MADPPIPGDGSPDDGWQASRDIAQRCGLPPAPEFIPELRALLDREAAIENLDQHEYLRTLCLLLWANNDPEDCVRIAQAKFMDFDAGCTVDEDFLVCGTLEETRARLAAAPDLWGPQRALAWLADWTHPPERIAKIAFERTKWGVVG
jgi:hypothetical protein